MDNCLGGKYQISKTYKLRRALAQWKNSIWINPVNEDGWRYTQSTQMIRQLFGGRMYPLTLAGLDAGMKELG